MDDEKPLPVDDPAILLGQLINSAEEDLERLQKEEESLQHLARLVVLYEAANMEVPIFLDDARSELWRKRQEIKNRKDHLEQFRHFSQKLDSEPGLRQRLAEEIRKI